MIQVVVNSIFHNVQKVHPVRQKKNGEHAMFITVQGMTGKIYRTEIYYGSTVHVGGLKGERFHVRSKEEFDACHDAIERALSK